MSIRLTVIILAEDGGAGFELSVRARFVLGQLSSVETTEG
jgi:hypothetical protein